MLYFFKKNVANLATRLLLIPVAILFSTGCQKVLSETPVTEDPVIEMDRLSFASVNDFQMAFDNYVAEETKSSANYGLKASLLCSSSRIDIEKDPVLSYEFRNITRTKADDNESIYELGGYDELVPDEKFAAFLNARAEIEVGGYIYKISPRGTYYFNPSKEDEFNSNYPAYEESDGVPVDSLTVQLSEGIFRYATFDEKDSEVIIGDNYYEEDEDEDEYSSCAVDTKSDLSVISNLQFLNWNNYPKMERNTGFFSTIFGSNYDWYFSNKKKFVANFFSYNYIFYKSIGCETRMYQKKFIFWGRENFDESYVGWSDIITETDLKVNAAQAAMEYKAAGQKKGTVVATISVENTSLGKKQDVACIMGIYLTQDQIDQALGKGLEFMLKTIKSKTKKDVSKADVLFVPGPSKIYTIYMNGGKAEKDTWLNKYIFYSSWFGGISIDVLNLPSTWGDWLQVLKKSIDAMPPKPELVGGQMHAAVKYGNDIGAVTMYQDFSIK